jgi:hypothetical protein
VDVEKDDVDLLCEQDLLGLGDVLRLEDAVAVELEVDAAEQSQRRLVVDHEHRRRLGVYRHVRR